MEQQARQSDSVRVRKRPVEVEAMCFTGRNRTAIVAWMSPEARPSIDDGWDTIEVRTLEGPLTAHRGDWIIKGVQGEFYPCKPEIFEATYEVIG